MSVLLDLRRAGGRVARNGTSARTVRPSPTAEISLAVTPIATAATTFYLRKNLGLAPREATAVLATLTDGWNSQTSRKSV